MRQISDDLAAQDLSQKCDPASRWNKIMNSSEVHYHDPWKWVVSNTSIACDIEEKCFSYISLNTLHDNALA